jgi:hypothetical protein
VGRLWSTVYFASVALLAAVVVVVTWVWWNG